MKRYSICKNCKEVMTIKSSTNSRHELEDERGRYFHAKCEHCHIDNEYHVNEVTAEIGSGNMVKYISFAIALFIASTLYFFRLGLIWTATFAIPVFVYLKLKASSEKAVQLFNMGEISRTRPS